MNQTVVKQINDSPFKAFFAIAGGGQSFIGDFTKIPGASNTMIGALVPYHQSVFTDFVGYTPAQFVANETARRLALASYKVCLKAGVEMNYAIGVGATSAIVKDNERAGREHKFFVATHSDAATRIFSLILKQGRNRAQEDAIANDLIALALESATLNPSASTRLELGANEKFTVDTALKPRGIGEFQPAIKNTKRLVIYPGSWNPIHDGHRNIHSMAEGILEQTPFLEFSLVNTDKLTPDFIDVRERIKGLDAEFPYIMTEAPTFKDKVRFFKNTYGAEEIVFVLGADTWERVWMDKYAGPLPDLHEYFKIQNVKFLVFGRSGNNVNVGWGEDLKIKAPEAEAFSSPLRSTEIRKQNETTRN